MEEIQYKILRLLDANPRASQRQLAKDLGISLGKTNYCLKALVEKGWIKIQNFKNTQNKVAYAYILTPRGATGKVKITMLFLKRKREEFEAIKNEIAELQSELEDSDGRG